MSSARGGQRPRAQRRVADVEPGERAAGEPSSVDEESDEEASVASTASEDGVGGGADARGRGSNEQPAAAGGRKAGPGKRARSRTAGSVKCAADGESSEQASGPDGAGEHCGEEMRNLFGEAIAALQRENRRLQQEARGERELREKTDESLTELKNRAKAADRELKRKVRLLEEQGELLVAQKVRRGGKVHGRPLSTAAIFTDSFTPLCRRALCSNGQRTRSTS
jgi:hypothetical protein